jgi:hypothetical protein
MKKCSTTTPDYKMLEFAENEQRPNIYDLVTTSSTFSKFKYFRLEIPKQDYLLKQGVKYVCESWNKGYKTLHTGLIPIGIDGCYYGNFVEFINGIKKTSLMIFLLSPEHKRIQVFYFNHYSKRSIFMNLQFTRAFLNELNILQ